MVEADKFKYKDIRNGEVFELGNRALTAISFPGHTEGSMCFWNAEENYCLVGDSVANVASPVLFFQKCRPLEDYRENLAVFLEKVGKGCALYTGHNKEALSREVIAEIPQLCDEVLAGKTEHDTPYLPPFIKSTPQGMNVSQKELGDAVPMEHKGQVASIKYNANKIRIIRD